MKNNLSEEQNKLARTRFMNAHEHTLGATSQWLTEQGSAQTPDEEGWRHVMRRPGFEQAWAQEVAERRLELIRCHGVPVTRETISRRSDLTPARRLLLLALDPTMVDVYQILPPRPDWEYGKFFAVFRNGPECALQLTQTPGGFVSDFITLIVHGYDRASEGAEAISASDLLTLVWNAWLNSGPNAEAARTLLCKVVRTVHMSYERTFDKATFIAAADLRIAAFQPDAVLIFNEHAPVNQLSSASAAYIRPSPVFRWEPIGALDLPMGEFLHGSEPRTLRASLPYREKYIRLLQKGGCDQGVLVTNDAKFVLLTHRDHVDWDGMRDAERIAV